MQRGFLRGKTSVSGALKSWDSLYGERSEFCFRTQKEPREGRRWKALDFFISLYLFMQPFLAVFAFFDQGLHGGCEVFVFAVGDAEDAFAFESI